MVPFWRKEAREERKGYGVARSSEVLILAMAKTNMATGRKKYGNIAVEKVFGGELGIRRPGDGNIRSYLSLSHNTANRESCSLRRNVEEEREGLKRRGKLNLFGRNGFERILV